MEDLFTSKEKKVSSKPDIKQIFEFIFSEQERFYIFWKAWKNCAEIKGDDEYSDCIAPFINDIGRADSKCKYSIRPELYDLIENSPDPIIGKRAMNMKSFLFI